MEGELDRVEEGEVRWRALLEGFYGPFQTQLEAGRSQSEEIIKELLAAEGETCEICGRPMQVRWNKFGRFLGCSGYPECQSTRPIDAPEVQERSLGDGSRNRASRFWPGWGPTGPTSSWGTGTGRRSRRG